MKPTLRRTALRPFQRKDFDTYHRLLTNKQVLEFVKSGNASLSECQSEFEHILRVTPSLFKCYHFAITLASQDKMIGMIQVGFSDLWQEWNTFACCCLNSGGVV
jgi:RimJ/RimL family protein N-acetyltransferase